MNSASTGLERSMMSEWLKSTRSKFISIHMFLLKEPWSIDGDGRWDIEMLDEGLFCVVVVVNCDQSCR